MEIGLFISVWVVRYLGPEQFGLLSYAQSFVFLFTAQVKKLEHRVLVEVTFDYDKLIRHNGVSN